MFGVGWPWSSCCKKFWCVLHCLASRFWFCFWSAFWNGLCLDCDSDAEETMLKFLRFQKIRRFLATLRFLTLLLWMNMFNSFAHAHALPVQGSTVCAWASPWEKAFSFLCLGSLLRKRLNLLRAGKPFEDSVYLLMHYYETVRHPPWSFLHDFIFCLDVWDQQHDL